MNKQTPVIVGLLLALAALPLLGGCSGRGAVTIPGAANIIELDPSDVSFTRIAEAKDCSHVILGIQSSLPSFQTAEQEALQEAGAEHLLNKVEYEALEKAFYIPNPFVVLSPTATPYLSIIYGQHCRYVEGHGIKRR